VRIERIFNRVIFDELLRKNPPMKFSFFDDLDVQWAGHPTGISASASTRCPI